MRSGGLNLRAVPILMHGVAPHMCGQAASHTVRRGSRGSLPRHSLNQSGKRPTPARPPAADLPPRSQREPGDWSRPRPLPPPQLQIEVARLERLDRDMRQSPMTSVLEPKHQLAAP